MADSPESLMRRFAEKAKQMAEQKPVVRPQKDEMVTPVATRDKKPTLETGADLKKNPLSKVFEKFLGSDRLIKDLNAVIKVEKDAVDIPIEALHYQLADTWAREAIYKHKDPQEVLDAITRISIIYADNPQELARYKQLMTQVLTIVTNSDNHMGNTVDNSHLSKMIADSNTNLDEISTHDKTLTFAVTEVKNKLKETKKAVEDYYRPIENPQNQDEVDRYLNPRKVKSAQAKIAAVNINAAVDGDALLFTENRKIDKIRENEIDKRINIPVEDAKTLNDYLTLSANKAAQGNLENIGIPTELQEYDRLVREKGRIATETLKNIKDTVDNNKGAKLEPPEIEKLRILLSVPGGENFSVEQAKKMVLDITKNPEAMAALGGDVSGLEKVIEIRAEEAFNKKQLSDRKGFNAHLSQAGITDAESTKAFSQLERPDNLIASVRNILEDPDERSRNLRMQQFAEEFKSADGKTGFSVSIEKLANELLGVADAADDVFFEHLFNPLIHEPLYNNIITGLDKLQNKILTLEKEKGRAIQVNVREYDYKKRKFIEKSINFSEAIGRLQDKVKVDREWKKYTHNIYVLMLSRSPLETYKNYSNSVSTAAIDMMLVDNERLEDAIRLHMGYLRSKLGLSGWRTPTDAIYTPDARTRTIPVDEYVRDQLRHAYKDLSESDIKRLASMARGYVLGVSWEAIDTMASGSPVGGTPGRFLGYFGPLDKINFNNFVLRRWSSDAPIFDYLFTRIHGKGSKEPWDVRRELIRSKEYQAAWADKEPDRVVTDKMVEDGIPFLADTYYTGIGGLEMRWGWRKQMYKHLTEGLNSEIPAQRELIIRRLMTANLSVANRYIEDWSGTAGKPPRNWSKVERNRLRKIVLEHMKQIAPQEFIILEHSLAHHDALKKYWYETKDGQDTYKLAALDPYLLAANSVTNYLLENTKGLNIDGSPISLTLHDLFKDQSHWEKIFAKDNTGHMKTGFNKIDGSELTVENLKMFLWHTQSAADAAINGTQLNFKEKKSRGDGVKRVTVEKEEMVNGKLQKVKREVETEDFEWKDTTLTLSPWQNAAYIRSFPTHLAVKRNGNWSTLKENVVGRMATDNDVISTAIGNYWNKVGPLMKDYQANGNKAKQEKFATFLAEVQAVWKAYQDVHGNAADLEERASSYRISYQLVTLFDKYFAKSWYARLPLGVGSYAGRMTPFSSWSHYATGIPTVLQFDEQTQRVVADEAIKKHLVAPPHGRVLRPDSITAVKIPGTNITLFHKFKFDKMHWNGAQMRSEFGASNIAVTYDILRSYIPLVIGMIALAGASRAVEEESKQ